MWYVTVSLIITQYSASLFSSCVPPKRLFYSIGRAYGFRFDPLGFPAKVRGRKFVVVVVEWVSGERRVGGVTARGSGPVNKIKNFL